jgi:hypothetical protein
MRPITKIFLLLVVAFVVYLIWPRTADMKAFDPARLGGLQVAAWQAEKAGKGLDALKARYSIYSSQYGFDPISAFRIAQNQASAWKSVKRSREANDPNEESRSIAALTEKYTTIKKQAKGDFDPAALAREEFAVLLAWFVEETGAQSDGAMDAVTPQARIFAGLYGGSEADFMDVAAELGKARTLVVKGDASTGQPDISTAKTTAIEADKLLSEIAKTPVEPAAQ